MSWQGTVSTESRHTASVSVTQNVVDGVGKAHVQHAIHLVQYNMLQSSQVQSSPLEKVHNATRRADDDVHS